MRFKIYWASLISGSKLKFTIMIFAWFYFVFEGNFPVQAPWGAYIWRGDLTEGVLRCEFRELIFEGGGGGRLIFAILRKLTLICI